MKQVRIVVLVVASLFMGLAAASIVKTRISPAGHYVADLLPFGKWCVGYAQTEMNVEEVHSKNWSRPDDFVLCAGFIRVEKFDDK
jgi:hypothetical protein